MVEMVIIFKMVIMVEMVKMVVMVLMFVMARQDRPDRQDRHLNLSFQVTCDWQLSQFLRCLEKYVISSSFFRNICNLIKFGMTFRNVSICRSWKNYIVYFIKTLIWTKWIQIKFDKMPKWMSIILQLLYLKNLIKS